MENSSVISSDDVFSSLPLLLFYCYLPWRLGWSHLTRDLISLIVTIRKQRQTSPTKPHQQSASTNSQLGTQNGLSA